MHDACPTLIFAPPLQTKFDMPLFNVFFFFNTVNVNDKLSLNQLNTKMLLGHTYIYILNHINIINTKSYIKSH